MSAIHAIQGICQRYVDAKKSVFIVNIDHFSKDRLVRARSIAGYISFNILEKSNLQINSSLIVSKNNRLLIS